ncbi:glycosyltransferase family 2 protein [Sphingomonas sp. CV7422]|uniref:glycosyltransferase family 2 protein n=1 Tax=Sphingomonas sp. CV7422 TaxID=3018036 RepID=UPI0022FE48CC|nr:glycosyltransferase family 2 protein [Sphingomonas sp. CV7422]
MRDIGSEMLIAMRQRAQAIDVSIVMPCLDEVESLPHCIANAHDALARIKAQYGFGGEVVIADNGSTDGSQALAEALGARVVPVVPRGYGAAIIGGCEGAFGRYLLIGDADGSYDFTDGVPMIGRVAGGADLCMGSRFKGGVARGAMPWKNRYIGNPALTGILNLFFNAKIDDAHCGLRAIRRDALLTLGLSSCGMEFASEMVIKASLRRLRIAEVPATLSIDLRNRGPHLRPWRDGWRHLRYLLIMSPTWAFGIPSAVSMTAGTIILAVALLHQLAILPGTGPFGSSWLIVAGFLVTCGHGAGVMAAAMHLHSVREGHRLLTRRVIRIFRVARMEILLLIGVVLIASSLLLGGIAAWRWTASDFAAPGSVLPIVGAAALGAIGLQTMFGAIMLAIVGGSSGDILPRIRHA